MGHGVGGGGGETLGTKIVSEKINPLVVNDVRVLTREVEVERPKYVEREIVVTNVNVKEETVTTQHVEVVNKIVEVSKPVFKEVVIQRPVYIDKEVADVKIKRVDLPVNVPRIVEKVEVREREFEVKVPKLVEEIVKVPKIVYVPTEVERIIWKDVPRERCKHCGKEVE